MSRSLTIKRTYRIQNTASSIWQSLVCPALIDQYNQNCASLRADSEVCERSVEQCDTFQSGDILDYEKDVRVKFSTFDPNAGLANLPQNYIHITYELQELSGETELSITIENFMEETERFSHSQSKWNNEVYPGVESLLAS